MLQATSAVLTGLGLALVGLWGARVTAHALILKGLRAPRVAALTSPDALGLAAQPVNISGPNGKTLFAWFMPVPGTTPTPAILVMHGWGANASMMLPSVPPLAGARFDSIAPIHSMTRVRCPVLLVHGEDDEMVPFDDAKRLLAAGEPGRAQLLVVTGRHDPSEALQTEPSQLLAFLKAQLGPCQRA